LAYLNGRKQIASVGEFEEEVEEVLILEAREQVHNVVMAAPQQRLLLRLHQIEWNPNMKKRVETIVK